MKGRKTTGVQELISYANDQLARTDEFANVDFKCGVITMIERVLHDTNNYQGFMFLNSDDCETGTMGYFSRRYFSSLVKTGV
jgi:hypothetical protein